MGHFHSITALYDKNLSSRRVVHVVAATTDRVRDIGCIGGVNDHARVVIRIGRRLFLKGFGFVPVG